MVMKKKTISITLTSIPIVVRGKKRKLKAKWTAELVLNKKKNTKPEPITLDEIGEVW
jgi:hypothetical protein